MEKLRFLICSVVGFLGLLAAALAFVADAKRVQHYEVIEMSKSRICVYPESPSEALGITSALALLVAEIVANAAVGCVCCCGGHYRSRCRKAIAIICLVVSWIICILALGSLIIGVILNEDHGISKDSFGNYSCSMTRVRFFLGGAVMALISVILCMIYYILTSEVKKLAKEIPTQNQNIAMAHPYSKSML